MLSVVYFYVKINYKNLIEDSYDLNKLMEELYECMKRDGGISDIIVDKKTCHIILEVDEIGLKYINNYSLGIGNIKIVKGIYYMNSAYKYRRKL